MATRKGYIPENLRIYSRTTQTFTMDAMWGSGWRRAWDTDTVLHEIKGRKAFAVDAESKGYKTTAEKWAKASQWHAPQLTRLEMLFECGEIYEDVPNAPISDFRIISLEHRGQGGRAYKILTSEGYVYDLREDQLIEAMIEVGVKPGGFVGGEWVWSVIGGQMKIVRVGSKQHDELTKTSERRKRKKIGVKDLVVGTIFSRANGERQVFCGFATVEGMKGKHQLWWDVASWKDPAETQTSFTNDLLHEQLPVYAGHTPRPGRQCGQFKLTKSHSCVGVDGTIDVPDNVIEEVRGVWYTKALNGIANYRTAMDTAIAWEETNEVARIAHEARYAGRDIPYAYYSSRGYGNFRPTVDHSFYKPTCPEHATMRTYGESFVVPEALQTGMDYIASFKDDQKTNPDAYRRY